jgi:hypothetical protein
MGDYIRRSHHQRRGHFSSTKYYYRKKISPVQFKILSWRVLFNHPFNLVFG